MHFWHRAPPPKKKKTFIISWEPLFASKFPKRTGPGTNSLEMFTEKGPNPRDKFGEHFFPEYRVTPQKKEHFWARPFWDLFSTPKRSRGNLVFLVAWRSLLEKMFSKLFLQIWPFVGDFHWEKLSLWGPQRIWPPFLFGNFEANFGAKTALFSGFFGENGLFSGGVFAENVLQLSSVFFWWFSEVLKPPESLNPEKRV